MFIAIKYSGDIDGVNVRLQLTCTCGNALDSIFLFKDLQPYLKDHLINYPSLKT